MKTTLPGAIFKSVPILAPEDVPTCPKCGKKETFVMHPTTGISLAGCMACGEQWKISRLLNMAESELHADEFWREVGRRVRAARIWFGASQAVVAEAIGYTRTSIVNLEAGRQHMDLYRLYKLAHLLGCRLHDIIPDEEENDENQ